VRNVDGQSPLSLANAFQVTKGAMTNTLQRLEAKGYVTVEPDPADGRAKIVRITRAGRAARNRALAAMTPEIARLLGEIKAAEFAAALPFLTKLKDVLDRRRD
jgi:DNA-binding MarR family transcriptional regulator